MKIAIIGGTGLTELKDFEITQVHENYQTDLGSVSSTITEGVWHGVSVLFLARHGHPHTIPPHKINYRANILALYQLGVTKIIAVNAVGGIHPNMDSGHIAVPNQIVDYTHGREATFFDGQFKPLDHIDFTFPYTESLRELIVNAYEEVDFSEVRKSDCGFSGYGVYGATQGPRLETIAEIDRMEKDGCDLVGMTGMPEAALARELEIDYAAICLVVNPAAGRSDDLITMEDIRRVLDQGIGVIKLLLSEVVARVAPN